jgi:hypothetical protein
MFTSPSDPTLAGLCLLAQIMFALDAYGDRLRAIECRIGLAEREQGRHEVEGAVNRPLRKRGRPRGSLNKPKEFWTNGLAP